MARPREYKDVRKCQLRMDAVLYEKLKYVAARDGRSLNNEINYCAMQTVKAYEQEHGEIEIESDNP